MAQPAGANDRKLFIRRSFMDEENTKLYSPRAMKKSYVNDTPTPRSYNESA